MDIAAAVHQEVMHYFRGQFLVSLAVGGLTALGLLWAGVPYWLLLGVFMVFCNMIPTFGPWIGAAPVALTALPLGWRTLALGLGVVLAVQQLDMLVLSPRIVGNSLKLHPAAVMVGVLAGAALFGPVGLVLAMPILILCRTVISRYLSHQSDLRRREEQILPAGG